MALLCCCSQFHPLSKSQTGEAQHLQGLPTRPPPAKLPPHVFNGVAISPQSTEARSSLTSAPLGAAASHSIHLAELVLEDSKDDSGDDGLASTSRNRSTSTLDAVKARIRRHLSQDSITRHCQSESEEQVARRAEVKRLMRMRIQEELQTESPGTRRETRTSEHPAPSSVTSATLPGNGPRDTIEFTVDEFRKDNELTRIKAAHPPDPLDDDGCCPSRALTKRSAARFSSHVGQRPVSLRDWNEHDLNAAYISHRGHGSRRSSLPEAPDSTHLGPVRKDSSHDAPSPASWRLSLSADQLADLLTPDKTRSHFRPVASPTASFDTLDAQSNGHKRVKRMRSKSSPLAGPTADTAHKPDSSQLSLYSNCRRRHIPKSQSLVRDESPVGLWLRAQSQQFRLSTASPLQSDHDPETGSVDQAQADVHHQTSFTPAVTRSPTPSSLTKKSSIQFFARDQSPAPAQLFRRGFAGMMLPSFNWHPTSKDKDECKPIPPPKTSPEEAAPNIASFQPLTPVISYAKQSKLEAESGSSSFFSSEAELRGVKERFRDSQLRKEPLVPVDSKSHEVLSNDLHFEIHVDKFDGNESQGHLKVPSMAPRPRGFSSSKDGDETAELWKRALRAESVSKSPRRSMSSQLFVWSQPGVAPVTRTEDMWRGRQDARAPCPSTIEGRSGSDSLNHSPICTAPLSQAGACDEAFRQQLATSNAILEKRGQQLQRQEYEHKPEASVPAAPGPRLTYKMSTPPASWAKFPSHNREERNGTAGEADNVRSRDFAVRRVSAAGAISWTTDKGAGDGPSHRSIVRSVSDRFTLPIKSRWTKLLPGRLSTDFMDRSIPGARRSSIQASGHLEYPELELLPTAGGYRGVVALEKDINEMKGLGPTMGSSFVHFAAPDNRTSLVEKMGDVVQSDGSADDNLPTPGNKVRLTDGQDSVVKIRLPATPAQTTNVDLTDGRDLTGSSGETYATPMTHFSLSRSRTPQDSSHFPSTHTPVSAQSTASVIRHTSLCVPKTTLDLSTPMTQIDLCNSRGSSRRRSAPPVD